jgi:drug/metabolite transporter (DMT)-like permease
MSTGRMSRRPALRGGFLALLAAFLFGISTPVVQMLGHGVGPFATAGLLYAGAALVGAVLRRPAGREAALTGKDTPRLLTVAFLGAVLGPVALAWGLQRTGGMGASLMLTLEAAFTALFAWWFYGESMDRRTRLAVLLLIAGGAVLVLGLAPGGDIRMAGLMAVMGATLAWALDSALSRALAERDPGQVVLAKATFGVMVATLVAYLAGETFPGWGTALGLFAVGASGYGLSLHFYLLAQRAFGAARTGSVFAFAPFAGAALAFFLGDRSGDWSLLLGGILMLAGVLIHLTEAHQHEHVHEALEHEHAHTHDDGHHLHHHAVYPPGTHSHRHRHESATHAHPHVPDIHHQHRH